MPLAKIKRLESVPGQGIVKLIANKRFTVVIPMHHYAWQVTQNGYMQ